MRFFKSINSIRLNRIFKSSFSSFDIDNAVELIKLVVEDTRLVEKHSLNIIDEYTIDDIITVRIIKNRNKLEYTITEPALEEDVIEAIARLYLENPRCKDIACIEDTIRSLSDQYIEWIYTEKPLEVIYNYFKLSSGYGPLYPLTRDPHIEEIAASSEDRYISIIHRKYSWYGWMSTNIAITPKLMDRLVLSLARIIGRHLSIAQPIAEGLTPEGLRLALTFGHEVSRKGSSFVIRKKPSQPITITKLIDQEVILAELAAYAWLVLELKGSILIVGGMSTGKTTLLQALLTLIPPTRRVVTIEDTPEITGTTGLWDPLVERVSTIGDKLSINMYDLLKFSLRRRADYIVVGEVRGREARLLVQASRLGHGVLATMHADTAQSVIERLTAPPISIPKNLLRSIWSIFVMDATNGRRHVREIFEIDHRTRAHRIAGLNRDIEPCVKTIAENTIRLKEILDEDTIISELASRTAFLQMLVNKGVFDIYSLGEKLIEYYSLEEEEYESPGIFEENN